MTEHCRGKRSRHVFQGNKIHTPSTANETNKELFSLTYLRIERPNQQWRRLGDSRMVQATEEED